MHNLGFVLAFAGIWILMGVALISHIPENPTTKLAIVFKYTAIVGSICYFGTGLLLGYHYFKAVL